MDNTDSQRLVADQMAAEYLVTLCQSETEQQQQHQLVHEVPSEVFHQNTAQSSIIEIPSFPTDGSTFFIATEDGTTALPAEIMVQGRSLRRVFLTH